MTGGAGCVDQKEFAGMADFLRVDEDSGHGQRWGGGLREMGSCLGWRGIQYSQIWFSSFPIGRAWLPTKAGAKRFFVPGYWLAFGGSLLSFAPMMEMGGCPSLCNSSGT